MISLRARLVRLLSKQMFKRISPGSDIPTVRNSWEELAARNKPVAGTRLRHATIAGVECDWLVPPGCEDAPVLYYLHGGAYVMGSSKTHRAMVSHIATRSGMRALLPNYRLAPEHRFPAGLEDCVIVYRQLLANDIDPTQIVIAGDSAGGGMSVATLLSLRDAGDPLPSAAVLLSPWLDLAGAGESAVSRADHDPWFNAEDMPQGSALYCDPEQFHDPLVSPVYADVHGLPPMLIQVGDHEILLSDATRMADKLSAAGGEVTLQVWPDMWHVFQYFIGRMPESKRAIRHIARYLRDSLGTEAAPKDAQKAA